MRTTSGILLTSAILSAALLSCFEASAQADTVIEERSHWNTSKTRIYTELTIAKSDGSIEKVTVPGGRVDGYAMVQWALGRESPWVAYVREKTKSGKPFRWANSCVYITPDAEGTSDIPGDQELDIIESVLQHWESKIGDCSYIHFVRGEPDTGREVKFDGVNTIKFRHDKWCIPAMDGEEEVCHSPDAAAITTILYVPHEGPDEGVILDADIEVNAVNFAVAAGGQSEGQGTHADLANVLTHEIGHLLGLDHTCWSGEDPRPVDNEGLVVPGCADDLSSEVLDATMYNFLEPDETKKTSLEADDVQGLCEAYPKADDPDECRPAYEPPDEGWCSIATPGRTTVGPAAPRSVLPLFSSLALLLGALALVAMPHRVGLRRRGSRQ